MLKGTGAGLCVWVMRWVSLHPDVQRVSRVERCKNRAQGRWGRGWALVHQEIPVGEWGTQLSIRVGVGFARGHRAEPGLTLDLGCSAPLLSAPMRLLLVPLPCPLLTLSRVFCTWTGLAPHTPCFFMAVAPLSMAHHEGREPVSSTRTTSQHRAVLSRCLWGSAG